MQFYEKYCELCLRRGVSPSRAALEAGFSKSLVSKWKKAPGTTPNGETLKALSKYFGVPVNEFIYEDAPSYIEADQELMEYLDMLRNRPECRILLSTAKGATKDDVEANVRVIKAMRGIDS